MNRLIFILLFSICLTNSSWAQDRLWSIRAGINISSFTNLGEKSIKRLSLAISRDIPIFNRFSIITGFMMSGQGSLLENKPIKTDYWENNLYAYDIKVQRVNLDIPLLLGYSLTYTPIIIKPYTGFSYRIGLGDGTRTDNRKVLYNDHHTERKSEFENFNFEYRFGDSATVPFWISATGFVFNIGTRFECGRILSVF